MLSSRRTFLKGVGAAAGAAALGNAGALGSMRALAASKTNVTVWAGPFVIGVSANAPLLDPYIEQTASKDLTDVQLATDFGPGMYAQMESKYLVQARTGTPDVIEGLLENVVAYIRAGVITPIDARFNAWADKAQFVPSAVNGLMYNGQLLGVPYNTNARGLLYRKSILKKLGLKVPTTWDEMLNVGEAISAKMSNVAGITFCTSLTDPRGAQEWLSFFFQLNKHLFKLDPATKKWVVNTTPAQIAKVNELYYNLFYGSKTPAANVGTLGVSSYVQDPGYVSGLWGMVPMGPWLIGRSAQSSLAKQILTEDTGIASMPVAPGGSHGSYLEIKPWMINKYSKNPDAAWEVIQFLSSAKVMTKWVTIEGFTAPRLDVQSAPVVKSNWWTSSFAELLPQGVALDPLNWAPVYTTILTQLQAVVFKQSSPMQAATALHSQLQGLSAQGVL